MEAAAFVNMVELNQHAGIVEAAVFVIMEDKKHDAKTVPPSVVNMIKSK